MNSDSVRHNRVQVLSIPVLLLACSQDWTCNLQMIVSLEASETNAYNRYAMCPACYTIIIYTDFSIYQFIYQNYIAIVCRLFIQSQYCNYWCIMKNTASYTPRRRCIFHDFSVLNLRVRIIRKNYISSNLLIFLL